MRQGEATLGRDFSQPMSIVTTREARISNVNVA